MTSRQFRIAKRTREQRAVLRRGPRWVHGDGRLLPNLIQPHYVSPIQLEKLSREAADIIARLRTLDPYSEERAELERQLFWARMRQEGQCE
jgi:hypothetical protein